jgi:hypothetical protein
MTASTHGWSFRVPPGWPIPPAGWTPPAGWEPDPSWPQPPVGWVFWVPAQPVLPAQRRTSVENYWPTPARPHGTRVALMVLYLVGFLGGMFLLSGLVGLPFAWNVDPADYPTEAAYNAAFDEAYNTAMPAIFAALLAVQLVLFGILGQKAGYRGAGFLLALVPFYGYVVQCRLLWRWTDIKHWDAGRPVATYLPPLAPIGLPHHQRT